MTGAERPVGPGAEPPMRPKNDIRQYDDLAGQWWDRGGVFAMLHWLAAARAERLPVAASPAAIIVDIACGAGLFAPHARRLGYHHIGVDLGAPALSVAAEHGVVPARVDARMLPFRDACADIVVAGEILEHVTDPEIVVAEACRILKPGGTIVIDTIADTRRGRFAAITVAERLPGGPPPRLHDPDLFLDRKQLIAAFARHGVAMKLHGLFPSPLDYLRWLRDRSRLVRLLRTPDSSALFGGVGMKA